MGERPRQEAAASESDLTPEACPKIAYYSREAACRARGSGKTATKNGRRVRSKFGHRLAPYHCPRCGLWHLTSLEKR